MQGNVTLFLAIVVVVVVVFLFFFLFPTSTGDVSGGGIVQVKILPFASAYLQLQLVVAKN